MAKKELNKQHLKELRKHYEERCGRKLTKKEWEHLLAMEQQVIDDVPPPF